MLNSSVCFKFIIVNPYVVSFIKCMVNKGRNISVKGKKKVGMTIAQKSKETRVGMKDGNWIDLWNAYS